MENRAYDLWMVQLSKRLELPRNARHRLQRANTGIEPTSGRRINRQREAVAHARHAIRHRPSDRALRPAHSSRELIRYHSVDFT
ncbi:hypothetical protein, partial [Hyphomicrobium sp. D-2]|uniref:hypothetical protein n=1 Tax=Hyphomicrobium sp. D-2 TaxID=3041621 RepID=UPI0024571200